MVIWMKVSRDKYELPLAVAESQKELAIICGVKRESISRQICQSRKRGHRCGYVKVIVEEDEE